MSDPNRRTGVRRENQWREKSFSQTSVEKGKAIGYIILPQLCGKKDNKQSAAPELIRRGGSHTSSGQLQRDVPKAQPTEGEENT